MEWRDFLVCWLLLLLLLLLRRGLLGLRLGPLSRRRLHDGGRIA